MDDQQRETARRILSKFVRESDKPRAIHAFWRYVQREAQAHRYGDGFVRWRMVEQQIEEALARLTAERQRGREPAPEVEETTAAFDAACAADVPRVTAADWAVLRAIEAELAAGRARMAAIWAKYSITDLNNMEDPHE